MHGTTAFGNPLANPLADAMSDTDAAAFSATWQAARVPRLTEIDTAARHLADEQDWADAVGRIADNAVTAMRGMLGRLEHHLVADATARRLVVDALGGMPATESAPEPGASGAHPQGPRHPASADASALAALSAMARALGTAKAEGGGA